MCTLTSYQPVIPSVTFIKFTPAIPYYSEGSLCPTYVSVRLLGLTVKHAFRHYANYDTFLTGRLISFQFSSYALIKRLYLEQIIIKLKFIRLK